MKTTYLQAHRFSGQFVLALNWQPGRVYATVATSLENPQRRRSLGCRLFVAQAALGAPLVAVLASEGKQRQLLRVACGAAQGTSERAAPVAKWEVAHEIKARLAALELVF